jgi:hypothetical protein
MPEKQRNFSLNFATIFGSEIEPIDIEHIEVRSVSSPGLVDVTPDTEELLSVDGISLRYPGTVDLSFSGNMGMATIDFLITTETGVAHYALDVRFVLLRIHVDTAATGNGNGSSWDDAFTTLHEALAADYAVEDINQEIWIAGGTYYPGETGSDPDRSSTFSLVNETAIYGGFVGTESGLDQRAPSAFPTILSGDLDEDDVDRPSENNMHHVVTASGVGRTAVLDGVTITGGLTDGQGGGVTCTGNNTEPIFRNCDIVKNDSGAGGVNISNISSGQGPSFINCCIAGNLTSGHGSGIIIENASSSFINCQISGNRIDPHDRFGGGLALRDKGNAILINCSIAGNLAEGGFSGHRCWQEQCRHRIARSRGQ